MSYDFDILSVSDNHEQALSDLKQHLTKRPNVAADGSQFIFELQSDEEEFIIELNDDDEFVDDLDDYDDEENDNSIAWISINFFRSAPYYEAVIGEIEAILATGKFFLYDPQEEETIRKSFDKSGFLEAIGGLKLESFN